MADGQQMTKIVPLITGEIPFCQYVCKLVFGVDKLDLNLGVQTSETLEGRAACDFQGLVFF